jgi:hypothetical protein
MKGRAFPQVLPTTECKSDVEENSAPQLTDNDVDQMFLDAPIQGYQLDYFEELQDLILDTTGSALHM